MFMIGTHNRFVWTAAVFIAFLVFVPAAKAGDMYSAITEDQMTLAQVKSLFDTALLKAELIKDNAIRIEEGGIKVMVSLDQTNKLITISAIWNMKASGEEIKKLQFINILNDKTNLIRYSMMSPTRLWCDYQMSYDGGITPYTLMNHFRLFGRNMRLAIFKYDRDNLLGTD